MQSCLLVCWLLSSSVPGGRGKPCIVITLQWRYNKHDGVSNNRRLDCLLSRCLGANKKIKASHHWPLWGESTGERRIPLTRVTRKMFPFDDIIMYPGISQSHLQMSLWIWRPENSYWRYIMATLSTFLVFCEGSPPAHGSRGFWHKGPVMWNFDFFVVYPNKSVK